jgi:radical SAM superfamily enzyme YgiQ (UPF0313 family)
MGKDEDAKGNKIPRQERLNLAKKFVEAGCVSAGYSLESGNDEILKAMNKKVKAKFKVFPSAYAGGAIAKCRKVGAANYGNKSKNQYIT